MKVKDYIILALVVVCGLLWMFRKPDTIVKTETVTEIRYDTVWNDVDPDTVWNTKYVKIPPVKQYIYVKDSSGNEIDSVARYEGQQEIDSTLTVLYQLDIQGLLQGVNFGIIDKRPERVITVRETTTVTNTINPKGLYASFGVSMKGNFWAGASYMHNRKMFGLAYDPMSKNVVFDFKVKIGK